MNKLFLFVVFICITLLSFTSCKKSKEAENLFQKIVSFEILGMKFGSDKEQNSEKASEKEKNKVFEDMFSDASKAGEAPKENSIALIVAKTSPKVVNIEAYIPSGTIRSPLLQILPNSIKSQDTTSKRQTSVLSTGFLISWEGYLVTTASTIFHAEKIFITTHDKKRFRAKFIAADLETDIAVLKADLTKSMEPVTFASSDNIQLGENIIAIANPLGSASVFYTSIITSIPKQTLSIGSLSDLIQTSTLSCIGCNGSPLINNDGNVVGMSVRISEEAFALGFAIPANLLKNIANQLIKNGKVARPWIGLELQELDTELADSFGYLPDSKKSKGIVITEITEDSPAAKANLKAGDIILTADGESIDSIGDFKRILSLTKPSDNLSLAVYSHGSIFTKTVTPILPPDKIKKTLISFYPEDWAGVQIDEMPLPGDNKKSIYISSLSRGSPASMSGMKSGNVIITINDKPVTSAAAYLELMGETEKIGKARILAHTQDGNRFFVVSKKATLE